MHASSGILADLEKRLTKWYGSPQHEAAMAGDSESQKRLFAQLGDQISYAVETDLPPDGEG